MPTSSRARLAEEDQIPPLGAGEARPENFFTTNHFTGGSVTGRRAVIVQRRNESDSIARRPTRSEALDVERIQSENVKNPDERP